MAQVPPYTYQPQGRRDPFVPPGGLPSTDLADQPDQIIPSSIDALYSFMGGAKSDPSTELSALRNDRKQELQSHIANLAGVKDTGPYQEFSGGPIINSSGRQAAPEKARQETLLGFLQGDMDADPQTGLAAQARDKFSEDTLAKANLANSPVLLDQQHHQEKQALDLMHAAHPDTKAGAGLNPFGLNWSEVAPPGGQFPPAPAGEDYAGRFQRMTAHLPAAAQAALKSILEYRQDPPSGSTALAKFEPYIALAQQIDPSFNMMEYKQRNQAATKFRTGTDAATARSLNQAIGHLDQLNSSIDPLGNAEGVMGTAYNTFGNWLHSKSNAAVGNFTTPRIQLGQELGTLMHGQPSEAASKQYFDVMDVNAAPSVQRQSVASLAQLMQTSHEELQDKLRRAMNLPEGTKVPDGIVQELLTGPNREILERLAASGTFNSHGPAATPPAADPHAALGAALGVPAAPKAGGAVSIVRGPDGRLRRQ